MGNLVIGRRLGESVYLSFGEVAVRVVIARAGAEVKLAIEAPLSVVITRGEFHGVGADAAMAARVSLSSASTARMTSSFSAG